MGKSHHKIQGKTYDKDALTARENHFFDKLQILSKNVETWKTTKKIFIEDLYNKNGKLRAKAFPGRAAILVKLLDLNEDIISVVYEKPGSLKIGNYLPGTQIPIQSDDDLFALADKSLPIVNFAWHIPSEIRNYLKQNGYTGEVFDILSSTDFVN
jgi:C-methyltransferase C-terminal domain